MKFIILGMAAIAAAVGFGAEEPAVSAPSIERVLVRQQWPWNEKVAIDFVLTNVTSAVQIDCAVYRGENRVAGISDAAFSGDICELDREGAYRIMFDPSYLPARPANGERLRFVLTPSEMDDSSRYREVLYKIFDLENAKVTDVSRGALLSGRYGAVETDYGRIGEGYSSPLDDVLIWTGVTNYPGTKTTKIVFRKIPTGGFSYPKSGKWENAGRYEVNISKPFWIGVFELTQKQYEYFANTAFSSSSYIDLDELGCNLGEAKPLQNVAVLKVICGGKRTWDASSGALANLKTLFAGEGSYNFDLPTAAMWYRAMMAESKTYYYDGIEGVPENPADNERMAALGRFAGNGGIVDNGDGTTTTNGVVTVGQFRPNAFGLYDMIGNVMECTRDSWVVTPGQHFQANATDPIWGVADDSNSFGLFGNSWNGSGKIWPQSSYVINLHHTFKHPYIGVRLAFFEGDHPNKPAE